MSAVTVMRWHVERKCDITEYVLTLRRLSWNCDVRLDIMMLIFIYITKQSSFKKFEWSSQHYDGRLHIMKFICIIYMNKPNAL